MKKNLYILLSAVLVLIVATSGIQSSNGKAGKNKAPGETSCVSCHSGNPENSGSGSVTLTGLPTSGYVPGTTYNLTLTVSQSGIPLFGFGVEALKTGDVNAGNLVITDAVKTILKSATVSGTSRLNVVQTDNSGLQNDNASWNFDWIAPSADSGAVTFYYAGIACDNNGGTSGDYVYYAQTVVNPFVGIAEKQINENNFTVFPIPAKDKIAVNFFNSENSVVTFSLYDVTGKLISTLGSKQFSSGNHVENFLLPAGITEGVYFITIDNGKKLTKKISVL